MYTIQMRFIDSETGYLESTSNEITAEVFSVFWQPTELQADTFSVLYCAAGSARYHVEDFPTREEAEEYIRYLEEEESENN